MHSFLRILFLLCLSTLFSTIAFAQEVVSKSVGSISGMVKDSTDNLILPSATAAVYLAKDTNLVSYKLVDKAGKFSYEGLPTDVPLLLIISYTGYTSLTKKITIPFDSPTIDLKPLLLSPRSNLLEDVVITPPMTIRGDTIEFNADAFHLEPNAVVEDLLKKLPGIVIWADGAITINGKEVNNVLVDGKPFFGGSSVVATQNIPKSAVDKIQVYDTYTQTDGNIDSTKNLNITLKEDKNYGYFGKAGTGYGTLDRNESDLNVNLFNPKGEISVVAGLNNINKAAGTFNQILESSTFSSSRLNSNYRSDYSMSGIRKSKSIGVGLRYNFVEKPSFGNENTLNVNYLRERNDHDDASETETSDLLEEVDRLSKTTGNTVMDRHDLRGQYSYNLLGISANINSNFSENRTNGLNQSSQNTINTASLQASSSNNRNITQSKNQNFQVQTSLSDQNFNRMNFLAVKPKWYRGFSLNHNFSSDRSNSDDSRITEYIVPDDPNKNEYFNRNYKRERNQNRNSFRFSSPDFGRMFSEPLDQNAIRIVFNGNLNLNNEEENVNVYNIDSISGISQPDDFLTNKSKMETSTYSVGMNITKSFTKHLMNRYLKMLMISFSPSFNGYQFKNQSEKSFQNIRYENNYFTPTLNIHSSYMRNNILTFNGGLTYNRNRQEPQLSQLAPLIDSANIWSLIEGNLDLKAANNDSFSLNIGVIQSKIGFSLDLSASLTLGSNAIILDRYTDELGRSTGKYMNAGNSRNKSLNANARQQLKFNDHIVQLGATYSIQNSTSDSRLNGDNFMYDNSSHNIQFSVNYMLDKLHLKFEDALSISKTNSDQSGFFASKNTINTIKGGVYYPFTPKFSVRTDIRNNMSKSSVSETINFAMWDASLNYKFMQGNKAELSFKAFDILNQNKMISNMIMGNVIQRSVTNTLTQYFMLSLSYFPRQFGR